MKHHFISAALAATALLLGSSLSLAAETKAVATGDTGSKAAPVTKSADAAPAAKGEAKPKAAARVKPVDINSARKEELKKLPGIGDAEADKIIAGRPYGSKAWLVSNNIIPEGTYMGIAGLIEAKQPFTDGAKNAEIYRKLNEKKAAEQKAGDKK